MGGLSLQIMVFGAIVLVVTLQYKHFIRDFLNLHTL
ncbi:hypothetical protein II1_02827 [Bacillus cereus MC118]|uniref:Uncharacterized protein n=1 Tax=Bacillus cereus MC67 TaxID=1053219 RepID=J8C9N6_BACCE|nr:hypothetical protein II3_01406 [Bacillus cereus MC67]EOP14339.1 hypothetical protein II1_02827 [Bacillus cereus MC118]